MRFSRALHFCVITCCVLTAAVIVSAAQEEKPPPPTLPTVKTDQPFTQLGRSKHNLPTIEFFVLGERYEMEVAATASSRERGMGGRAQFLPKTGMVFVHAIEGNRSYWMKDCLFDIDLAYLDNDGRIVALHEMKREPPRHKRETLKAYKGRLKKHLSNKPARYALEFPPGTLKRLNFQVGQVVPMPHQGLRKMTP